MQIPDTSENFSISFWRHYVSLLASVATIVIPIFFYFREKKFIHFRQAVIFHILLIVIEDTFKEIKLLIVKSMCTPQTTFMAFWLFHMFL